MVLALAAGALGLGKLVRRRSLAVLEQLAGPRVTPASGPACAYLSDTPTCFRRMPRIKGLFRTFYGEMRHVRGPSSSRKKRASEGHLDLFQLLVRVCPCLPAGGALTETIDFLFPTSSDFSADLNK